MTKDKKQKRREKREEIVLAFSQLTITQYRVPQNNRYSHKTMSNQIEQQRFITRETL